LGKQLVALTFVSDSEDLERTLGTLFQQYYSPEDALRVLSAALRICCRCRRDLVLELLNRCPSILHAAPVQANPTLFLKDRRDVLEWGFRLAAFQREDQVARRLVPSLMEIMSSPLVFQPHIENSAHPLDRLVGQCIRSLRKLGLRDEMAALLQQITDLIGSSQDLVGRFALLPGWSPQDWQPPLRNLRILLRTGGGWASLGQPDRLRPALDLARKVLFQSLLHQSGLAPFPTEKEMLACTYAEVVAQLPREEGLPNLEELFQRLGLLANAWSTKMLFSLFHLSVVESAVLPLVDDDRLAAPTAVR
jgi:hypothetical protein